MDHGIILSSKVSVVFVLYTTLIRISKNDNIFSFITHIFYNIVGFC